MVMEPPDLKIYSDPFAVDPLPRAHYFPSPPRNLNKIARKTALSPERLSQHHPELDKPHSHADKSFLQHANTYSATKADIFNLGDASKFDESWPSSERPSSASLTALEESPVTEVGQVCSQTLLDRFQDLKKTLKFSERDKTDKFREKGMMQKSSAVKLKTEESSTIHRYIERFRHGKPMSREERKAEKTSGQKDFWWTSSRESPPTHSSSSKLGDGELGGVNTKHIAPYSPLSYRSDKKNSSFQSEISDNANDKYLSEEKETKTLQERADRLLEKSSSSLASTCPVVSTEGLGSSTSDMSSFEEPCRRPAFTKAYDNLVQLKINVPRSARVWPHPEDDILYQWRLKRKMELARETPLFSRNILGPSINTRDQPTHQDSIIMDSKLNEFKRQIANIVTPNLKVRTGSVQLTPAPLRVTQEMDTQTDIYSQNADHNSKAESQLITKKDQIGSSCSKSAPPIASPTLGRKHGSKGTDDLEPHLHLMCDLLPCPHGDMYRKHYSKTHETDGKDNSADNEQTLYKQYLQAERPDIDNVPDSVKQDVIVESKSTDCEYQAMKNEKRDERQMEKKILPKKKPSTRERVGAKNSDALTERVEVSHKVDGGQIVDNVGPSRAETSVSEPLYSSSPKVRVVRKTAVESVIGEVVKDQLFDLSSSTVLSSVDSLPSFSTPERCQVRRPHPKIKEVQLKQKKSEPSVENEEEEYLSDGEFEDDQLLQLLRHQRSQFEQQLRHIDQQLANILPGSSSAKS